MKQYIKTKTQISLEDNLIALSKGVDTLEAIYNEIRVSVFNFAFSIVKDIHTSEDILHEVIIKIYNSRESYNPSGKPMAWILTITKNNALMHMRGKNKFTDISREDFEKISNNESLTNDEKILLTSSLEKLSDEERQIVILYALSGLKHKEIAELLDYPLSTILSKYNRALKKLKIILGGEKYER